MDIIIPGLHASIAFQCLLFACYLLFNERRHLLANRINLGLLAALACHMLFNLAHEYALPNLIPNLTFGFGLLYGPLIFLYIQALMYRDFEWRSAYWLHFLPSVVLNLSPLFVQPSGLFGALTTFISMGIYLLLSFHHYIHFRKTLNQTQSDVDGIAMRWALHVLLLNGASLILNITSIALSIFNYNSILETWAEIGVFLVLFIMVNTFLFKGLVQPSLFEGITKEDSDITEQSRSNTAIGGLDAARYQEIKEKLLTHMQTKKPYRDSLFNLAMLGRQIGESPRYVSAVINRELALSFADFVNRYRLAEVKQYLEDAEEQRTILDLIHTCGFSTKSNFNRVFKQQEGVTPSEYRKARCSR